MRPCLNKVVFCFVWDICFSHVHLCIINSDVNSYIFFIYVKDTWFLHVPTMCSCHDNWHMHMLFTFCHYAAYVWHIFMLCDNSFRIRIKFKFRADTDALVCCDNVWYACLYGFIVYAFGLYMAYEFTMDKFVVKYMLRINVSAWCLCPGYM